MTFRIKPLRPDVLFIYGFGRNTRRHEFVLTLEIEKTVSKVHAMICRTVMRQGDMLRLWTTIKSAVFSEWIEFEVLPEDVQVYHKGFDSIQIRKSKTFDGYESAIIRVKRDAKLSFKRTKKEGDENA